MKGIILAAGLGTRLRPVTDTRPKALIEVEGKTMLEHALEHLRSAGITDVVVNVHHFADQIIGYVEDHASFGLNILFSDERDELLETGGGVRKAAPLLEPADAIVVRNVDIRSDLDIKKMAEVHRQTDALATLAVRERTTSRYFLFDDRMRLCGWENRQANETILTRKAGHLNPLAFSGISILNPIIFSLITETGKFSLTPLFLRLSASWMIKGYPDDGSVWDDMGKNIM